MLSEERTKKRSQTTRFRLYKMSRIDKSTRGARGGGGGVITAKGAGLLWGGRAVL